MAKNSTGLRPGRDHDVRGVAGDASPLAFQVAAMSCRNSGRPAAGP